MPVTDRHIHAQPWREIGLLGTLTDDPARVFPG